MFVQVSCRIMYGTTITKFFTAPDADALRAQVAEWVAGLKAEYGSALVVWVS